MGDDSNQPKSLLNMLGQGFSYMLSNNIKHLHSNDQSRIDDGSQSNFEGSSNFVGGQSENTYSSDSNEEKSFFNQINRMVDETFDEESKRSMLTQINSILGDSYHQDDIKNILEISKGLFGVKENTEIGNAIECMQRNIKDPNCLNFGHSEILTTTMTTTEELELTPRVEASQWSSLGNEFGVK